MSQCLNCPASDGCPGMNTPCPFGVRWLLLVEMQ